MTVKHLFPAVEPSLNLDFANSKKLDPRITFTRSSTGTYVDSNGVIKTAAANEARFDHDPVSGSSLGLLVEESRTNEILNSQVFTSGYNRSGLNVITQNTTVTTPEGLTDGVGVITESSGGTTHQFYEASSAQITGIRTYSIFVKPNGRNYCVLMTSSFTHDLVNGTTLGSASGEFVSATTTKFPNGWVRCTLTQNHSNTYDQFNFKLAKDGLNDYSYSGDGVSGVYVWGAQLEAGSFPTSYIPTSGSTVTRSADVASMTGTNFSSWYSQTAGSFIATWDQPVNSSNALTIIAEGGSAFDFTIWTYNGLPQFATYLSHISQNNYAQSPSVAIPINTLQTIGGSYDSAGVTAALNGNTPVTSGSSTAVSEGATLIRFGARNSGIFYINGHLARFTYYPFRLTDAQLQALTL